MGLSCSCFQDPSDYSNQVKLETIGPDESTEPERVSNHRKTELIINYDDLLKIQGVLRGYIERRRAKEIYHIESNTFKRQQKSSQTVIRAENNKKLSSIRATTL
ncbi:unnamed protein product [Blepharisma stoltei]|uniref:Uncharacterized protein n=1 Tax=Blepharisma stoltei TaxID=1481888 RepID=A0AAU9J5B8_9CILI|nr:unnamed protein product [Blepharisma stoltei]